jgi:hypothetical protein
VITIPWKIGNRIERQHSPMAFKERGNMSLAELKEELDLYRREKNEKGVANVAFVIGDYYLRNGDPLESLGFF